MNTIEREELCDWCAFVVLFIEKLKSFVVVVDNDKGGNKYKCSGGKRKQGIDKTPLETARREIKTEIGLKLDESRLRQLTDFRKEKYLKRFFCAEITEKEFEKVRRGHDIKQITQIPLENVARIQDKILPDHYTAMTIYTSSLDEY